MNKIPKFLYANGEGLGAGLILINAPNPYIGRLIYYKSYPIMLEDLERTKPLSYALINGYSIAILYGGILGHGNRLRGSSDELDNIQKALNEMSDWFYNWRILEHEKSFTRYKI